MKNTIFLLLLGLVASQPALADESVAEKVGSSVKKGGEAAGHGIEVGIKATERGVKKGVVATGHGLEKAGQWIEEKMHGDK